MHFVRYSNQESLLGMQKKCAQPTGSGLKRPAHTSYAISFLHHKGFLKTLLKNKLKRNHREAQKGSWMGKFEKFKTDYFSENSVHGKKIPWKNSVEAFFLMPGKHRSLICGQDWVNKRLLLSQLKLKIHTWQNYLTYYDLASLPSFMIVFITSII